MTTGRAAPGQVPSGLAAIWQPLSLKQGGLLSFLSVLTVLLLALLWIAVSLEIIHKRSTSEAASRIELGNLARAFAEHTARTMEGADQAIRFVRREYLLHGAGINLKRLVEEGNVIDAAFRQVAIIGADGRLVQSSLGDVGSPVDLSDREHFRVHRDAAGDQLFISKPLVGRVSQQWSLNITRRMEHADGSFAGVVVLSLSPAYLTRFYADVVLGSSNGGIISLIGRDGIVRARQSAAFNNVSLGQDVSGHDVFRAARSGGAGQLWAVSPIDQVRRLMAFRNLDDHGLVVVVGRGEIDVFAEANRTRLLSIWAAAAVSVVLVGFMLVIMAKARAQAALLVSLRQSELQAQEANALKSRFIASVSHELRTPLNGILGYAQLVQETAADPVVQEYGDIIFTSGKHLHDLVNTILDLAKIESGQLQVHATEVDLRQVLSAVRDLHLVSAQAKGLALQLRIDDNCPQVLRTDRMRLLQILCNMVHNAVKFTDQGAVSIDARRSGNGLELSVTDTGPGIPPDRLEKIFVRFNSLAEEFSHPMQGAGLGLPLAKELSELIGGKLCIAPALAGGTCVRLWLPLADPAPQEPTA